MTRSITRNLSRLSRQHPERRRQCPVCERRHDTGAIPGELRASTILDERITTGVCSAVCRQAFYGLGELECLCGAAVHVAGADCLDCQQAHLEDDRFAFTEELGSYGLPTAPRF